MKALQSFLEFCYIARCNIHDTQSLKELEDALQCYHHHHKIFLDTGVWNGFNLPQHTLVHYTKAIHLFGAPNGLCSFITESKHIKAVKEPWQLDKCFLPTNASINSQQPEPISQDRACSKVHAYHQSWSS